MAVGLAVGLAVGWAVGSAVGLAVGLAVGNAGLGHPFSLASDARSGEKILQRWSRSPVRSDWVTRFLWYLARAARRKFYFCYLGARSVDLSYHWVSADLKNTKVEPCICTKHNARATKNLQKVFSKHNARKPEPRGYFFCLCKTAHFLIKRCTFSARGKFFGPGLRGEILGGRLSTII